MDRSVEPAALAGVLHAVDHAERHGDVERAADGRAEEAGRRDPDDRERHAVQRQRAAEHVGRPAEAPHPERVADHHGRPLRSAVAAIVGRGEGAAQDRRHSHDLEEAAAREEALGEVGFTSAREVEVHVGACGGTREELVLPRADLFPDRVGPGAAVQARQPPGLVHRKRAQDEGVHYREDRGVRADPERERCDRDEREGLALAQAAPPVAQVLQEVGDETRATRVAAALFRSFDAAELEAGAPSSLGLGHPARDEVRDLSLEVVPELGVELPFQPAAVPQAAQPRHGASTPASAVRIAPIASVRRFQLACSALRWPRPLAVSL